MAQIQVNVGSLSTINVRESRTEIKEQAAQNLFVDVHVLDNDQVIGERSYARDTIIAIYDLEHEKDGKKGKVEMVKHDIAE